MQTELDAAALPSSVQILGVNQIGLEQGNPDMCAGRTLPWLQDVAGTDAWALWQVTGRDVVILDEGNQVVGVYNLTQHPLEIPANYDELKSLITVRASD